MRRSRNSRVIVVTIALATCLAFIGLLAGLRTVDSGETFASVTPLTTFEGPEFSQGWSPDGQYISISRWFEGSYDLFVVDRTSGEAMRLTDDAADDLCARWSPDGQRLAYLSNEGAEENVYLTSALGGERRKIAGTNVHHLERFDDAYLLLGSNPWFRDGQDLLFSRLQADGRIGIWKIQLDTGQESQVTKPGPGEDDLLAAWSSDGSAMVFARRREGRLGLWLLTDGEPQPLLADEWDNTHPVWTPDDKRVVFESDRAGAVNLWEISLRSRRLRQLTTGAGAERRAIISKQGRLAYSYHRQRMAIHAKDLATGADTQITHHTRRSYQPRLSPDGRRLIYQTDRRGNFDLCELELATGRERLLTRNQAHDQAPDWSPDGSQVVFVSAREGPPTLWVTAGDGGPAAQLTDLVRPSRNRGTGVVAGPKWSPDGRSIGAVAPSGERSSLWVVDVENQDAEPKLSGVAEFGWYRDSRRIIYISSAEGQATSAIKAANLVTGDSKVLLEMPSTELAVSPDASGITFVSGRSHNTKSLWLVRLEAGGDPDALPSVDGAPEQLTDAGGLWHAHNGGWSWDGRSVVYARDAVDADVYLLADY